MIGIYHVLWQYARFSARTYKHIREATAIHMHPDRRPRKIHVRYKMSFVGPEQPSFPDKSATAENLFCFFAQFLGSRTRMDWQEKDLRCIAHFLYMRSGQAACKDPKKDARQILTGQTRTATCCGLDPRFEA